MNMFDLIHRRARLSPHRLAVEDLADGTRYTYRELNERAARMAAAARRHWGLVANDRLAYLGHSRAEFFALWFGCAKAGLILVPLNWRLAVPELDTVLDDALPAALIHGEEFTDTAALLAARRPGLLRISLGRDDGARHYDADLADTEPDLGPHAERSADSPWYLLYTSGTTGRPKGVIQTFRMMEANYGNIGLATGLTRDDILLNVLPMFHTAGINLYSSSLFWVGGTVLVQRQFDPAAALRVLASRATVFFGVPAVYQAMAKHPAFDDTRLDGVRSWGCGGATLPLPVAARYNQRGIRVRCGMGMTETGPTVFLMDEDSVLAKPASVGRPQLLTEVRVVDRDGRDVAPGEAGELWIRGPNITPGYWERPDATRDAFAEGGWLRSGDIVRCDADGDYTMVDRAKDMFISGAENVYPAEVEAVLQAHRSVAEVAVIGVPDDRWGEVGHACLVASGTARPSDDELRDFCRAALAGYKVPRHFTWYDALPRNALGKIIKQELRNAHRTP
ncbi:MAG: AMP-binding protein [Pigmentiphaga sp.]|nr:AMP-binding protein [Pigmentiphaga sp.]